MKNKVSLWAVILVSIGFNFYNLFFSKSLAANTELNKQIGYLWGAQLGLFLAFLVFQFSEINFNTKKGKLIVTASWILSMFAIIVNVFVFMNREITVGLVSVFFGLVLVFQSNINYIAKPNDMEVLFIYLEDEEIFKKTYKKLAILQFVFGLLLILIGVFKIDMIKILGQSFLFIGVGGILILGGFLYFYSKYLYVKKFGKDAY